MGTFTPVAAGDARGGSTTYQAAIGNYTGTVGNVGVHLMMVFDGDMLKKTAGGELIIKGLPFNQVGMAKLFPSGFLSVNGAHYVICLSGIVSTGEIYVGDEDGVPIEISQLSGEVTLTGGLIINT